jgi:hypothetical protein
VNAFYSRFDIRKILRTPELCWKPFIIWRTIDIHNAWELALLQSSEDWMSLYSRVGKGGRGGKTLPADPIENSCLAKGDVYCGSEHFCSQYSEVNILKSIFLLFGQDFPVIS